MDFHAYGQMFFCVRVRVSARSCFPFHFLSNSGARELWQVKVVGSGGDDESKDKKGTTGADINTASFAELIMEEKSINAANDVWRLFINAAESREAAGEVIYSALFESAPSLQSLFVTPRAVQAMKFMNGIASFVTSLDDPPKLKILVETLGFGCLT